MSSSRNILDCFKRKKTTKPQQVVNAPLSSRESQKPLKEAVPAVQSFKEVASSKRLSMQVSIGELEEKKQAFNSHAVAEHVLQAPVTKTTMDSTTPSYEISDNEIRSERVRLGYGSFSIVYKGEWKGETVAIKEFRSNRKKIYVEQFEVEAKLLEKCMEWQLPNLVRYHGKMVTARANSLVLEYLPYNLHDITLNWGKRYETMIAIAEFTARSHDKKMLYVDFKRSNVGLNHHYKTRVIDVGLALEVDNVQVDSYYPLRGTPGWIAPEIYTRNAFSEKSDIYAFGTLVYEMVSGREPYAYLDDSRENTLKILAATARGEHEKIPDDCPRGLSSLINNCWCKDPKQRPTAENVLITLEKDPEARIAIAQEESKRLNNR